MQTAAMQARQAAVQPKRVTRPAQSLPISDHAKQVLSRVLQVAAKAEQAGACPVDTCRELLPKLSAGDAELIRLAPPGDVIKTGLDLLSQGERYIAAATLALSTNQRNRTYALVRKLQGALSEIANPDGERE